jgi:outer membrane protein insertion porin family
MGNHFLRGIISGLLVFFFVYIGGMTGTAWANGAPAVDQPRVLSVGVAGNRFIEKDAVMAEIHTKPGDILSHKQIGRDVRALFDTGYFSNVYVEGIRNSKGVRLIYHVVEYPVVGSITYKGNDAIETQIFKFKLKIKPGHVLSDALKREEINQIRHMYLKKGYYQVGVKIHTTKRTDGRVDVQVIIDEGRVTHIVRILFVGNHAFSDADLRDQLASQQSGFISYFNNRDVFQQDRIRADAQLLMQYYQDHGYLDSKVESTLISLSVDKKSFYLTFNIYEGPQYRVSKVDLQGDLVPSRKALTSAVTMKPGEIYSLQKLRGSIQAVTEKVGDEGYAFATVTPLFHRDLGSHTVAITLDVEKGREIYIERIKITGNQKTEDHVIRRELRQAEASRYSASKIKRSKQRMNRLGYFKSVKVNLPRAGSDDRVNMDIKVDEKKTGSFTIGAGYSQLQKLFITTSLNEHNFLGKGYNTSIKADIGKITQNYNIGLTDPYFLGSNISASINAFKMETNYHLLNSSVMPYNYNNVGGTVSFGIPVTEHLTYGIGYSYTQNHIFNVNPSISSILIQAEAGVNTIGEVNQSLTWDSRDNIMEPHEGQYYQLAAGYAGLGGNQRFYNASLTSKLYLPLGTDFTLSPSIEGGYIHGIGNKQIPLWRRFSLGGVGSLRGFQYYGVTLRDPATNNVLGGDKMAVAALDLYFPIPYMQTRGFRGDLFYNAGLVWGSVHTAVGARTLNVAEPFSINRVRSAAGFELQWLSPVGPLALIWAFPIHSLPEDQKQSFQFALGTQF